MRPAAADGEEPLLEGGAGRVGRGPMWAGVHPGGEAATWVALASARPGLGGKDEHWQALLQPPGFSRRAPQGVRAQPHGRVRRHAVPHQTHSQGNSLRQSGVQGHGSGAPGVARCVARAGKIEVGRHSADGPATAKRPSPRLQYHPFTRTLRPPPCPSRPAARRRLRRRTGYHSSQQQQP